MFIFLDTETTGTEEKDRMCQLAYKIETSAIVNELFKPPFPSLSMPFLNNHYANI
jgi:exodeoxyribonuclease X